MKIDGILKWSLNYVICNLKYLIWQYIYLSESIELFWILRKNWKKKFIEINKKYIVDVIHHENPIYKKYTEGPVLHFLAIIWTK